MRLLSSGDVCDIAGLSSQTFNRWCRKGIIKPFKGGNGLGDHRRFTVMQTVGITLGGYLRRSDRGCVLPYVGKAIAAFSAMTEEELLLMFERGATHFVTVAGLSVVLDGPHYDGMFNVQQLYRDVMRQITEIEQKFQFHVGGRLRGLAGASKR